MSGCARLHRPRAGQCAVSDSASWDAGWLEGSLGPTNAAPTPDASAERVKNAAVRFDRSLLLFFGHPILRDSCRASTVHHLRCFITRLQPLLQRQWSQRPLLDGLRSANVVGRSPRTSLRSSQYNITHQQLKFCPPARPLFLSTAGLWGNVGKRNSPLQLIRKGIRRLHLHSNNFYRAFLHSRGPAPFNLS